MSTSTTARTVEPSWQRWFMVGLAAFFVAVSVQYSYKVFSNRSAILRFLEHLKHLDAGEDIYHLYSYPHPPVMALLLKPLTGMPPEVAALSWFYLKVALTFVAFRWVFRLVESPERPFPAWAKTVTVLLSLKPILGDLAHGNVNLVILFLIVAALYAYRRGRDVTAGAVLGLAVVARITPLLFIPYFIWKRAWKTLAGCAAGIVLFAWIVPGAFIGYQQNLEMLSSWAERWIKPTLTGGEVTSEYYNQSLPGLITRMTTHTPSDSKFVDPNHCVPQRYDNFLELDATGARRIVMACAFLYGIMILWSCRTPSAAREGWRLPAEFGLVLLGMLLFCERTWKHHCVTLLVPIAVVCYYLAACQPGPRLRRYLIGTLATAFVLMLATSTSLSFAVEDSAKLAQIYGAHMWAHLVLAAALVVLLRHGVQDDSGERRGESPTCLPRRG